MCNEWEWCKEGINIVYVKYLVFFKKKKKKKGMKNKLLIT